MSWYRRCSLLLLLSVLANVLPAAPLSVQAVATAATTGVLPPPPERRTIQPISYPKLPGLAVDVTVAPQPVMLGDTATISVTVTNRAPHPATNLQITLPTPDGAVPLAGPGVVSAATGWQWNQARLDGEQSTVVTATVQLSKLPRGRALLAQATVAATELPQPSQGTGGALVVDPATNAASAVYAGQPDSVAECGWDD